VKFLIISIERADYKGTIHEIRNLQCVQSNIRWYYHKKLLLVLPHQIFLVVLSPNIPDKTIAKYSWWYYNKIYLLVLSPNIRLGSILRCRRWDDRLQSMWNMRAISSPETFRETHYSKITGSDWLGIVGVFNKRSRTHNYLNCLTGSSPGDVVHLQLNAHKFSLFVILAIIGSW